MFVCLLGFSWSKTSRLRLARVAIWYVEVPVRHADWVTLHNWQFTLRRKYPPSIAVARQVVHEDMTHGGGAPIWLSLILMV